jgi:hypothetical protein
MNLRQNRVLKATLRTVRDQAVSGSKAVAVVVREAHREKTLSVVCPQCREVQDVVIGGGVERYVRTASATIGAVTLGTAGAVVGTGIGLASGGAGMAATVPLGFTGASMGAVAGDKLGALVGRQFRHDDCTRCGGTLVAMDSSPGRAPTRNSDPTHVADRETGNP